MGGGGSKHQQLGEKRKILGWVTETKREKEQLAGKGVHSFLRRKSFVRDDVMSREDKVLAVKKRIRSFKGGKHYFSGKNHGGCG